MEGEVIVVGDHAQKLGLVGHAQDDGDGADGGGAGFAGSVNGLCECDTRRQIKPDEDVVNLFFGNALRVAVNR